MEIVAEAMFFAFIAAVLIALGTIIALYNEGPPRLDISARVASPVVHLGADFVIHNHFDRDMDCAAWWHRYIYDDHSAQVLGFSEYHPVGSPRDYLRSIRIPPTWPVGKYDYEATIVWQCNWVQRIISREQQLPPVTIEVVK